MRPHLRFALVPFLLLACAPSEDRGCEVGPAPECGGGTAAPSDPIAVDSVARAVAGVPTGVQGDSEVSVTVEPPDVLRPLDARVTVARCSAPTARVKALKEGAAQVTFTYPDGKVSTASVTVALAKKAELVPFLDYAVRDAAARGGESLKVEETKEIVQLAGGKMIWQVRYSTATGTALRGRGGTTYTVPEGTTSTLVENEKDRELFELTTSGAGGKLELRTAGASLELPVRVVPKEAIASVRLFVEDDAARTAKAASDESYRKGRLHVLARAFDAKGATIFGVPYTFTLGSEAPVSGGELLAYEYSWSAAKQPLVAGVPGSPARAETTLLAATPPGLAQSDGRELAGCSLGDGRGASGVASGVLLGGLVALVARRRRARTSSAG
jgi:hypothetical protein